ncbi:unnamed protein product, partial [Hymenolepis diminuta]
QFSQSYAFDRVVNAAVEYAYGGIENISPKVALRLYHLAHYLQNETLEAGCIMLSCAMIEETNVSEVWSSANATKNEFLFGVYVHLVALNWDYIFLTNRHKRIDKE